MFKKFVFYPVIFTLSFSLFVTPALAQEDNETTAVGKIAAGELEVSEPGPFSFIKDIFTDVRVFLTRDPIKKSELQLKKASRQLLRVRKMIKENPNDPEVQEKLEKATNKYQNLIEKINERIEKVKETTPDSSKLKTFLDRYTDQQLLHQGILKNLSEQVPEKAYQIIEANRLKHLERFGEVMNKVQNKVEIKKRIKEGLENAKEAVSYRAIRLEILEELGEKDLPNVKEAIKEGIKEVKQERNELYQELKLKRQEIKENLQKIRLRNESGENTTSGENERLREMIQKEEEEGNEEIGELKEAIRENKRSFFERVKDVFSGSGVIDKGRNEDDEKGEADDDRDMRDKDIDKDEYKYKDEHRDNSTVCIQVITPAKNRLTGECREFATPCDVPAGWTRVNACGRATPDKMSPDKMSPEVSPMR
jgi:Sec-independent protein translocase protein TatA